MDEMTYINLCEEFEILDRKFYDTFVLKEVDFDLYFDLNGKMVRSELRREFYFDFQDLNEIIGIF